MILGAMNNPYKAIIPQIERFSNTGFKFLDMSAEWPEATPEQLLKSKAKIKDALSTAGFSVVGHTAWFLPYAHPYEKVRREAIAELKKSFSALAEFNAKTVTVHPEVFHFAYKNRAQFLSNALDSLGELDEHARSIGTTLVFEAFDEATFTTEELKELFKAHPKIGFHLDVGHANMGAPKGARIFSLLSLFKSRLMHVHASDNDGRNDAHLPIGAGKIKWDEVCKAIKKAGYDKTITLEVFSQDVEYLEISRRKFEEIWRRA